MWVGGGRGGVGENKAPQKAPPPPPPPLPWPRKSISVRDCQGRGRGRASAGAGQATPRVRKGVLEPAPRNTRPLPHPLFPQYPQCPLPLAPPATPAIHARAPRSAQDPQGHPSPSQEGPPCAPGSPCHGHWSGRGPARVRQTSSRSFLMTGLSSPTVLTWAGLMILRAREEYRRVLRVSP